MARLKRIDRYILQAFVTSYLPLAASFGLLFVIADGFTRLDRFVKAGGPLLLTMAHYYGCMLPVLYLRFGAFLTLAAGMFAIARLERNNEVMPIKAGGISVHRAMVPIFACGLVLAGVAVADAELLIPSIAREIRTASQFQKQKDVKPGILRDRRGNTLFAARYRPSTQTLMWVTFRTLGADGREDRVFYADRARWIEAPGEAREGGHWLLEDGFERDLGAARAVSGTAAAGGPGGAEGEAPRIRQRLFGSGAEGLALVGGDGGSSTSIIPIDVESLREAHSLLSAQALKEQYQRQRYLPGLHVQLLERVTAPLSHLILLLIGLPFVLREGGRGTLFVGVIALIAVCAGFFMITFIFHALGSQGGLDPRVAALAPVGIFGLLGIGLFSQVRT